jgi:phosphate/sulfate permease
LENFYIFVVVILFGLAISDLIVGVSNDAVNFLNSSIGSKAASFKIIMLVAALGIVIGATFSSGMMEVARKGIFHPHQFHFSEIMILFLAVMLTDIIILDLFNTFGLPTSTTVSIVFELLGAAVALSLIKIGNSPDTAYGLGSYINSSKALAIISGILISIIIAFTLGAIIQYIARIIFSFNYERTCKHFGSIWGGIAISAITYFILIKGAKGSSFITSDTLAWIKSHTLFILTISLIGWTIVLQFLVWLTRLNILKTIVLVGTFALAMAFAGNDLVNFIGVPLAGYESFKTFFTASSAIPDQFLMDSLNGPIQTPTGFLIIAGLIMVVTLLKSRKARSVTETELNLGRQDEGYERFGASGFSREVVRNSIRINNIFNQLLPKRLLDALNKRFDSTVINNQSKQKDAPSFDLVRASVNLVVASIIISFATSLKLPLSTTYVTFMVAMGTSLSDRAWGRESAVYRISGVITVIGGWFFTALVAFIVSLLIAFIIYYGGIIAISILLILVIFFVIRTHAIHRKRKEEEKQAISQPSIDKLELNGENILESCTNEVIKTILTTSKLLFEIIVGLKEEKRKKLKKVISEVKKLNKKTKSQKNEIHHTISLLEEEDIETGHFYVQVVDYLREIAHCLTFISKPVFDHVANKHKPLLPEQANDLTQLNEEVSSILNYTVQAIKSKNFELLQDIINQQQNVIESINSLRKKQVKMIKHNEAGTRNSMLYLEMINEIKNLVLYTINGLKAFRDFIIYQDNNKKKVKQYIYNQSPSQS